MRRAAFVLGLMAFTSLGCDPCGGDTNTPGDGLEGYLLVTTEFEADPYPFEASLFFGDRRPFQHDFRCRLRDGPSCYDREIRVWGLFAAVTATVTDSVSERVVFDGSLRVTRDPVERTESACGTGWFSVRRAVISLPGL